MTIEERRLKKASARFLAPQIIANVFHDGATIEVEDILELKKVNLEMTQMNPYGVVVYMGTLTTFAPGVRELSSSADFAQANVAKALMVQSLGHRMLAQFYIAFNKPSVKTSAFTDEAKAIKWLQAQLEAHQQPVRELEEASN